MLNKEVLVTEENIDLIMGGWMTKYYLIAQKNLNKVNWLSRIKVQVEKHLTFDLIREFLTLSIFIILIWESLKTIDIDWLCLSLDKSTY